MLKAFKIEGCVWIVLMYRFEMHALNNAYDDSNCRCSYIVATEIIKERIKKGEKQMFKKAIKMEKKILDYYFDKDMSTTEKLNNIVRFVEEFMAECIQTVMHYLDNQIKADYDKYGLAFLNVFFRSCGCSYDYVAQVEYSAVSVEMLIPPQAEMTCRSGGIPRGPPKLKV